jgi:hypothetical protein
MLHYSGKINIKEDVVFIDVTDDKIYFMINQLIFMGIKVMKTRYTFPCLFEKAISAVWELVPSWLYTGLKTMDEIASRCNGIAFEMLPVYIYETAYPDGDTGVFAFRPFKIRLISSSRSSSSL